MRTPVPLSLLLSAVVLAACGEAPPPPAPPKVVRTLIVSPGGTAADRVYSGELRARHETSLAFRIPGKLAERLVDAGAVVRAGQPLARLDAADAALQAAQAEAQWRLAEAEARRFRELRAKNFVSAAALDGKETALAAAAAQAGLAKNQAAYTTLLADRAGLIAAVSAEPGQVLAAGQPVFRLAPDGGREVAIAVPENEVGRFKPGMAAEVTLWSGGPPLAGALREIAPMADPATRTYAARVALPKADPRLPIGQTARVRFPGAGEGQAAQAIVLPLSAIFQKDQAPAVWVVGADQTVSLKPVSLASLSEAGAVVTGGLAGGERIVAAGVHKLAPGEKVRLAETAP